MEHLAVSFSLKELTQEGTFTGFASVFGIQDQGGDIVVKGAFFHTLRDPKRGKDRRPLLWSHNTHEPPIGDVWLAETAQGLEVVKGELDLSVARAREVHSLWKRGTISGLSIGYRVAAGGSSYRGEARMLSKLDLFELSACVFPMLAEAQISTVKADEAADGSLVAALQQLQAYLNATKTQERPVRRRDAALIQGLRQMKDFDEAQWAPVVREMRAWQSRGTVKTPATDLPKYHFGLYGTYRIPGR